MQLLNLDLRLKVRSEFCLPGELTCTARLSVGNEWNALFTLIIRQAETTLKCSYPRTKSE